jgi:hypothetical protein
MSILLRSILERRRQTEFKCLSVMSLWITGSWVSVSGRIWYNNVPASRMKRGQSLWNACQCCSELVGWENYEYDDNKQTGINNIGKLCRGTAALAPLSLWAKLITSNRRYNRRELLAYDFSTWSAL